MPGFGGNQPLKTFFHGPHRDPGWKRLLIKEGDDLIKPFADSSGKRAILPLPSTSADEVLPILDQ
jgi:hypothetical protein